MTFKWLVYILAGALASCRGAVLEDREGCPSLLYFDLVNAGAFGAVDSVQVNAFRHPGDGLPVREATTVRSLESHRFYLDIRQADTVSGSGVLGVHEGRLKDGIHCTAAPGHQFDSLFRFSFLSAVEPESFIIPVEFVKEHCRITLQFLNAGDWSAGEASFPYDVVIRSGTCGVDVLSGIPVQGPFECMARELAPGSFQCILPRQADGELLMELYGHEGQGLVHSFNLGGLLQETGVSWKEKNLPDVLVGVNIKTCQMQVELTPWDQEDIEYEY